MLKHVKVGEVIPAEWYNNLVDCLNKLIESQKENNEKCKVELLSEGVKTSTVVKKVNELLHALDAKDIIDI